MTKGQKCQLNGISFRVIIGEAFSVFQTWEFSVSVVEVGTDGQTQKMPKILKLIALLGRNSQLRAGSRYDNDKFWIIQCYSAINTNTALTVQHIQLCVIVLVRGGVYALPCSTFTGRRVASKILLRFTEEKRNVLNNFRSANSLTSFEGGA